MTEPRISSFYTLWLHDYVRDRGMDPAPLLGPLPPVGSFQPMADWCRQLDAAAELLHDPDLGLHFGQTINPQRFGVLGYLLHHCDTLGQATRRLQRYQELLFSVPDTQLEVDGDSFTLSATTSLATPHYQKEVFLLAAHVQFARELTGRPLAPLAVGLASPAPADSRALEAFLACPVSFAQGRSWIRAPLAAMTLPSIRPDATLRRLLEDQAGALLATLPQEDDYLRTVRQGIAALLQEGEPTLDRVAARLNISARTLHRRLAERGSGFRELLDGTRRQLAESYLRDERLNLADVALLLGYSEQSPFTHAFKRWTGSTPLDWRRQHGR